MISPQLAPWQGPKASPRLIAANTLVQISAVELEQAVTQELSDNPALEMAERLACPICGGSLHAGHCYQCSDDRSTPQEYASAWRDAHISDSADAGHDDVDPLTFLSVPLTLPEQLLAQLRLTLDERDYPLALYLVGNLNEHGYLTLSTEEIAQSMQVEATRIDTVLKELQSLDPPGIGARNSTECLLLQLERLAMQGISFPPNTRTIIQHYFNELGRHQFESIRSALHITREEVEEAFLFIRHNLHPYPAHQYCAQVNDPAAASPLLVPSVLIQRSQTAPCGYAVEVVESQRFLLRLNPLYQHVRDTLGATLSAEERGHVSRSLEQAKLFIEHLQRRYSLLYQIVTYLVDLQRDFLDHGPAHLHPLTQTAVAHALSIHISTMSRAISNKFAQLPTQELIPISRFFATEGRAQELIQQCIAHETTPLSDGQIARILKEQSGITVSRQMVANYRAGLGIPSTRLRKVLQQPERE